MKILFNYSLERQLDLTERIDKYVMSTTGWQSYLHAVSGLL